MVRWDFDAVSELSNYLSKRKPIGEYRIIAFDKQKSNEEKENYLGRVEKQINEARGGNFISVGKDATPLGEGLADYITKETLEQYGTTHHIHTHIRRDISESCDVKSEKMYRVYQGFQCADDSGRGFFTQHPGKRCLTCKKKSEHEEEIYRSIDSLKDYNCVIAGKKQHTELTQLILWREDDYETGDTDKNSRFRVSLIGSSGPATLATTLLFVDEEQKQRFLDGREDDKDKDELKAREEFLVELQEIARNEFVHVFIKKLMKRVKQETLDIGEMRQEVFETKQAYYFYLVECAVRAYLSTVLYRYFLPFLSERDIKRIHNGMRAFLEYMKAAGESPFALEYYDAVTKEKSIVSSKNVENIIQIISEELLGTLKAFKGLEVFYKVTVQHGIELVKDKDTRQVMNMEICEKPSKEKVNCLFVFTKKTNAQEKNI